MGLFRHGKQGLIQIDLNTLQFEMQKRGWTYDEASQTYCKGFVEAKEQTMVIALCRTLNFDKVLSDLEATVKKSEEMKKDKKTVRRLGGRLEF
jgi:hypothetical protein